MKKFSITFVFLLLLGKQTIAAEAGMPQLDPEYWASQAFWLILIFASIYLLIDKIFIPKIKSNIDMREDKIRKDLEEAKNFKEEAEKKLKNYQDLIQVAKNDAKKIISESRIKLNEDIQTKKDEIQKKIDQETKDADNEIKKFKSDSLKKVGSISEEMVSEVIKDIFGEELNKSSIKAAVSETLKEKNKNI
jgi:F-type H+-transporting ATPase subunit b|tara:strand:- start:2002 stop:2574 length:573 start_codon:yes stop_codon:yes gene_type:complete